jgi:transcriptional regulator CtsR
MIDIYQEILEFEKMKNFDRDQLVEDYIQQLLECMDYKTMESIVYDTLQDNLATYTDEQLITEVTEYNPELLGESETL